MSVLILDMKFPKTCAACEWSRYSFPNAWCCRTHKTTDVEIAKNGRPGNCPLIEIHPHGRLIDADAYAQEIRERYKSASEWYEKATDDEILARAESTMITFTECFLTLKKMPTVIPAEESKDG